MCEAVSVSKGPGPAGKRNIPAHHWRQEDLATCDTTGQSPIPPIDNVHLLHCGTSESARGRYTVHMYFIPEETYLAWDAEPAAL